MTTKKRVLTGITTSGTPHLGNYVGAVRPTVRASKLADVDSYYFLADYHALIKTGDPLRVQRSTQEIAATWIACGLDPEQVTFYRQSDIPEIPELTWFLTCITGKGLLNRAHAYKAAVDKNTAAGEDTDTGVTAGLFMYPVLMAADILMFNAHEVPVGRDQIQHIEMARDMASSFNHLYGEHFTLPEALVEEHVATLPGLDGRKMSKSYDNTIPLFVPESQLRKLIMGIVTDSRAPGETKDTEGSALFQLYQAFASAEETAALAQAYAEGIGWGEVKDKLFARLNQEIAPMRERYDELMKRPADIEDILLAGARKARAISGPFTQRVRHAVGIRALSDLSVGQDSDKKKTRSAMPTFKQYREKDGLFYFKLTTASGDLVLHSTGFSDPKEAAGHIRDLKTLGSTALAAMSEKVTLDTSEENVSATLAIFSEEE
ncbi:tryptophan--tRNA ligase [Hydrogenophaga sp. 5NK40-0174]|uniref:tryptophan--tRNA ligase n=1 Tax=Hydrogenophaga sp. 5NK40-0174 TaxID=3127649 RepID=UPI0031089109